MKFNLITSTMVAMLMTSSLIACSGGGDIMEAEFSSMTSCLDAMKRKSGGSLNIISDEIDKVSGKLKSGEHFSCERVTSGSRGTYIKGWYTID